MDVRQQYDQLTEWRIGACIITKLTTASRKDVRDSFLGPLTRETESIFSSVPADQGGLSETELWALHKIQTLDETKFLSLKLAFIWISLVHNRPFLNYFLHGDPMEGNPPPPIANRRRFEEFVNVHLPKLCETFFSQNTETSGLDYQTKPTYKAIVHFDRECRQTFLKVVGIPVHQEVQDVMERRMFEYNSKLSKK